MVNAIQNIKTKKFVTGTDYQGENGTRRIRSGDAMLTFGTLGEAKQWFVVRKCGKFYRIVELKPVEVKRRIEFDSERGYEWPKRYEYEEEEMVDYG